MMVEILVGDFCVRRSPVAASTRIAALVHSLGWTGPRALGPTGGLIASVVEELRVVGHLDCELGETGGQDAGEAQIDVREIVAGLVVALVCGQTGFRP